jgi:putative membrane protein
MSDPTRGPTSAEPAIKLSVDRTRLSYERTMLSWIRTATSLITFGFSIQQFFRVARGGDSATNGFIGPRIFGLLLISAGLIALLLAALEHRAAILDLRVQYPLADGYPVFPRSRARLLGLLIAILGLLALFSMLFRG